MYIAAIFYNNKHSSYADRTLKSFRLDVSNDNTNWKTLCTMSGASNGTDVEGISYYRICNPTEKYKYVKFVFLSSWHSIPTTAYTYCNYIKALAFR